jgi:hypothetical protein
MSGGRKILRRLATSAASIASNLDGKNPVILRLLLASMAPRFVSRNTNTFL